MITRLKRIDRTAATEHNVSIQIRKRVRRVDESLARFGWLGVVIAAFGTWWGLSVANVLDANLFPSPGTLGRRFLEMSAGALWTDILQTLKLLMIATIVFIVVGTAFGIMLGTRKNAFDVSYGPIGTLFATPKITLLPIFVLTLGVGLTQKVMFGAFYGLFPLIMIVMVGSRNIPPLYQSLMRTIGAPTLMRVFRLYIPAMLPFFFSGLRIGYVYAGIGILLSEMYVSVDGLGQGIMSSVGQKTLASFWIYVFAATSVLLVGSSLLRHLERKLERWRT